MFFILWYKICLLQPSQQLIYKYRSAFISVAMRLFPLWFNQFSHLYARHFSPQCATTNWIQIAPQTARARSTAARIFCNMPHTHTHTRYTTVPGTPYGKVRRVNGRTLSGCALGIDTHISANTLACIRSCRMRAHAIRWCWSIAGSNRIVLRICIGCKLLELCMETTNYYNSL